MTCVRHPAAGPPACAPRADRRGDRAALLTTGRANGSPATTQSGASVWEKAVVYLRGPARRHSCARRTRTRDVSHPGLESSSLGPGRARPRRQRLRYPGARPRDPGGRRVSARPGRARVARRAELSEALCETAAAFPSVGSVDVLGRAGRMESARRIGEELLIPPGRSTIARSCSSPPRRCGPLSGSAS